MKLGQSFSFPALLVAGLVAFCSADAFVYSAGAGGGSGGSLRIALPRIESFQLGSGFDSGMGETSISRSSSGGGGGPTSRQFKDADEAFRELRRELGKGSKKWRGRKTVYFGNDADGKDAARKWVEKSFDLASELNSDFALSTKKRDSVEKVLRKYRRWAELVYGDDDDEVEVATTETEEGSQPPNENAHGDDGDEVRTVNPHTEYSSDDETFRVAVDLPGVERDDVEVTVEDDSGFLVVRATRSLGGGNNRKERKYTKKIDFGFDEVDVERMEASYDNGVLVVSAPKRKKPEKTKRRIPIV